MVELARPLCKLDGCNSFSERRGLCHRHRQELERGVPFTPSKKFEPTTSPRNGFCFCGKRIHAAGLCRRHYGQKRRGSPCTPHGSDPKTRQKKVNSILEERLALTNSLDRCREDYENAIGWRTRIVFRRELEILEQSIGAMDRRIEETSDAKD